MSSPAIKLKETQPVKAVAESKPVAAAIGETIVSGGAILTGNEVLLRRLYALEKRVEMEEASRLKMAGTYAQLSGVLRNLHKIQDIVCFL
jgi:hypothetical protein